MYPQFPSRQNAVFPLNLYPVLFTLSRHLYFCLHLTHFPSICLIQVEPICSQPLSFRQCLFSFLQFPEPSSNLQLYVCPHEPHYYPFPDLRTLSASDIVRSIMDTYLQTPCSTNFSYSLHLPSSISGDSPQ